jgi:hypothetical protein
MATTNPPTVSTLGMQGLRRTELNLLGCMSGAEIAIDLRPKAKPNSVEWISRFLRWKWGYEPTITTYHHLPDLHEWEDNGDLVRRLAATVRKYRNVLLVCTCPTGCARGPLAERLTYFIDDLIVTDLDPYRPAADALAEVPEDDMDPVAVESWLARKAEAHHLFTDPGLAEERDRVIDMLDGSTIYTVTCLSETLRKRSVTGTFRGTDKGKVLLLDANGRLQRLPVERISLIRADFNPFEEVAA